MRADSPGHSAKYGSYTLMELESEKVLDIQLVQSNEYYDVWHLEKGVSKKLDKLSKEKECQVSPKIQANGFCQVLPHCTK
uniref:Uncharacterized protein n=1 Tax=Knipowitschia caucasica TaxID=637954 RepID=A0AAV2JS75_KNICA